MNFTIFVKFSLCIQFVQMLTHNEWMYKKDKKQIAIGHMTPLASEEEWHKQLMVAYLWKKPIQFN